MSRAPIRSLAMSICAQEHVVHEHKCLSAAQVAGQNSFWLAIPSAQPYPHQGVKLWLCTLERSSAPVLPVAVLKFGLGFADPSGSSKVVASPMLKAMLQHELGTSKHLIILVQQFEACS